MVAQSALAKLLCGNIVEDESNINNVLCHLSKSIDNVVTELENLESLSQSQISLFAPLPDTKLKSIGFQYKFDNGGVLNVAGSYLKGTYDIPARSDCNMNCDGFFNLIYNPYAATNVSGNIIVRYFGTSYTHPF